MSLEWKYPHSLVSIILRVILSLFWKPLCSVWNTMTFCKHIICAESYTTLYYIPLSASSKKYQSSCKYYQWEKIQKWEKVYPQLNLFCLLVQSTIQELGMLLEKPQVPKSWLGPSDKLHGRSELERSKGGRFTLEQKKLATPGKEVLASSIFILLGKRRTKNSQKWWEVLF